MIETIDLNIGDTELIDPVLDQVVYRVQVHEAVFTSATTIWERLMAQLSG